MMNIKNFLTGRRIKVFVLSLLGQFIISSLLYFGIQAPKFLEFLAISNLQSSFTHLISPQPEKVKVIDVIKPKLGQKPTSFKLKNENHFLVSSVQAAELIDEEFDPSAYLVVNLKTGDILSEENSDQISPIASLTKIMTAVVALDLAHPDEYFTVSKSASEIEPTKIGVVPGQKMKLEELLNALLLTSANDAAQVIAEGIDEKYGEPVFIKAMNLKAEYLGLKSSQFENPQGFDGRNHKSSASDLAILSQYALEYPLISQIVQKDYQLLPEDLNHKQFDLYNWNGLIGVYPGTRGIKIGYTEDAGRTTVVVSQRGDQEVLVVLLGAPGILERDLWAAKLLDLGFEKLGLNSVNVTEEQLQEKYQTWKYWN